MLADSSKHRREMCSCCCAHGLGVCYKKKRHFIELSAKKVLHSIKLEKWKCQNSPNLQAFKENILFLHILHIFWHLYYIKSFRHIENLTQRILKLWSEVVELKKMIKNGQTPKVDKRWSVKSSSRCSSWWVRRGRRSLRVPPKLKGHWGSAIRTIRKLYCT